MSEAHRERVRSVLRLLSLFSAISDVERSRLELACTLRALRKGDALWMSGDKADVLFVLVEGRVKIVRHGLKADVLLELFGPGEAVGAVAGAIIGYVASGGNPGAAVAGAAIGAVAGALVGAGIGSLF